jgi:hypothetical protein
MFSGRKGRLLFLSYWLHSYNTDSIKVGQYDFANIPASANLLDLTRISTHFSGNANKYAHSNAILYFPFSSDY